MLLPDAERDNLPADLREEFDKLSAYIRDNLSPEARMFLLKSTIRARLAREIAARLGNDAPSESEEME